MACNSVAPPHGERGLKYIVHSYISARLFVAPPHGERGLKFNIFRKHLTISTVAPPHGERGLKYEVEGFEVYQIRSLPLMGSVD